MRPGEVCAMRWAEIDTSRSVWLYGPRSHNCEHHGTASTIPIGPRAQEILEQVRTGDEGGYVFSPARAEAHRLAGRAAARKTPRYPSHVARNLKNRTPQAR